jgi:uncharacterized repeat protein (TIGR01451 family)
MTRKQLIIPTVLAAWLSASAVWAEGEAVKNETSASSRRSQPAAPIFHRRTTLPPGWFKQGNTAGALTDTKVTEARPVAHFDTTGEPAAPGQGVAQRIRQIRESVVFDDLPAAPASGAPAAGESSRRPSSATPLPGAPVTATNAAAPTANVPAASPSAALPAAQPPSAALPEVSATAPTSIPAPPATNPLAADSTPSGNGIGDGTVGNHVADSSSSPSAVTATDTAVPSAPLAGAFDRPVEPKSGEPGSSQPGSDASTAIPGVDQLPSVMKRSTPRHTLSQSSTATVTEHHRPSQQDDAATTPWTNEPIASPVSADPEETSSETAIEPTESADMVLLNDQSPVLAVVTRGPKTMVVGKTASYAIDVTNQSDLPAKDVVVRVNIPQWVEIAQQNPSLGAAHIQPDDSGNAVLAWTVDRLNGRAQEKLLLDLIPRGSRPLDLGVTWTFSPAESSAQIQVQEPKLHLTVLGPQDVLFGETKVYTITVSNPGTGNADNVVLNLLPLIPGERSAGVRNLGTIAPGTRRSIEVELTTRQTGQLQVRAEATGDGGLMARGQQEVIVRRASLDVQVEGPGMKYAGTRAHYLIRVANSGDAPATDVVAVATLPAGAKEVASSDGGSLDPNTGQVNWHVGELRPGAARVFELECTLMAPGENRVDLRTVAAGDISALGSAVTKVESLADLKLTVNDPPGAVAVGTEVVYEVRITNRGTKEAENIQLYGYFSEGVEPVSVAGWRGQVNEGEVVLQQIPRLGAGQEMLLRISAKASRSGDHVFRAELECTEPETKLAVEEWTRFYGEPAPEETTQQADRRPTPGPGTPVKPLKLHRH